MAKGAWGITTVDRIGEQVDGTAGAYVCALQGVLKQNSASSPFLVANEFVCGRLAICMGLPVPAGDVVQLPDGQSAGYISLRFGQEQPPRVIPSEFVRDHRGLALRLLAFDCWIANDDRHEGNLAYARGLIPPMIFDHDKALLGPGEDGLQGVERLERHQDSAILNGCIAKYIKDINGIMDGVIDIADETRWIAKTSLPRICDSAEGLGILDVDQREAVERFLTQRASALTRLMDKLGAKGQGNL